MSRVYRIWKNSDSYDTVPYGPLCIEALTCRRPPRARTEIALQADVLCGLSTCRCRPLAFPAILHPSEPPSSREEETPRCTRFSRLRNGKRKREIGISFLLLARGVANLLNFYTITFLFEKNCFDFFADSCPSRVRTKV